MRNKIIQSDKYRKKLIFYEDIVVLPTYSTVLYTVQCTVGTIRVYPLKFTVLYLI